MRKKPWVSMASHVSKWVLTFMVAGLIPMTDVPVNVSLGRQTKGNSGRFISMVQRVESSQSPVCSMACMVYVGVNTFLSMPMLKR